MKKEKLASLVESLLFVSTKPLTARKLADMVGADQKEVEGVLKDIFELYGERQGGVILVRNGREWQMMTAPDNAKVVQEFLKDEMTGELTRPSLETLTIIAYRGLVTKAEIEQIRGVNCSLILRNLLIRGLVEAEQDKKTMTTRYKLTFDFLRHLGVRSVEELPDFEKLNADRTLQELLSQSEDMAAEQEETSV